MSIEVRSAWETPMRILRIGDFCAVIAGVLAIVAETDKDVALVWSWLLDPVLWAVTGFFALDFLVRSWIAARGAAEDAHAFRHNFLLYLRSPAAWADLAAAIAVPLPYLAGSDLAHARLVGIVWLLKLVRYSSGLAVLGRVMRNAADALLSVLLVFGMILVGAAAGAYLLEGEAQPAQFGSIPRAIWWSIVTLTTTGYGDEVPATLAGRILAGAVMVAGIGIFALWAGILASGFADERRRRDFLRTWDLVAKVPLFQDVGADVIADVARLLRRRDVQKGQVVFRRGQRGEAMYFIVSGEVEVNLRPRHVRLSEGQFFGEMALIAGAKRSATVVATERSVLLELDVADFRQLAINRPELAAAIAEESAQRRANPPTDIEAKAIDT